MTGPEHYKEAERLLGGVDEVLNHAQRRGSNGATAAAAIENIVSQAQVHATLALTAATVEPARDWTETLS